MRFTQILEHAEKLTLLEANIVNQEYIDEFLSPYIEFESNDVNKWFKTAVKKYLINNDADHAPFTFTGGEGFPDWVSKAHDRGDKLFNFLPTAETKGHLDHIVDWLKGLSIDVKEAEKVTDANPNAQAIKQKGTEAKLTLDKLFKITVPQAIEMSEKWLKTMVKKASTKEDEDGIEVFYKFDDGYEWVKVTSKDALNREGKLMSHCVGSYYDRVSGGSTQIYSLRDPKNEPHATIEVTNSVIRQIKGKSNNPPINQYIPYVETFLQKSKFKVDSNDLERMGLISDKSGKLYNLMNIPNGAQFDGNLKLDQYIGREGFKLPENLTLTGMLNLTGSKYDSTTIKLPAGLKVNSLNLAFQIVNELPEDLKVNDLGLEYTKGLTEIPDTINDLRRLLATHCKTLKKLPKTLRVKENMNISDTAIEELPDNLIVGGDLILNGINLKKFSKVYKIGGYVKGILDSKDLKELPGKVKYENIHTADLDSLESIGDSATFNDLTINAKLKLFPKKLTVKNELSIEHNHEIKTVLRSLNTSTLILLDTKVYKIEDEVQIKQLIIKDCPELKELPNIVGLEFILITKEQKDLAKWLKTSQYKDKFQVYR